MEASLEELINIPEIGERIAASVHEYFQHPENISLINKLEARGIQFSMDPPTVENNLLEGSSFVVSGVFQTFSRDEIKSIIKSNGGKLLSSVSGKLDFLVAGDKMGPSKLDKATQLGVKIISEDEFRKMIE